MTTKLSSQHLPGANLKLQKNSFSAIDTLHVVYFPSAATLNCVGIGIMRCPKCGCVEDKVVDSRSSKDGLAIRRRRQCLKCSQRYTTYEEIERGNLMVIKDGGARERFSREKLESGIKVASQKRPISADSIDQMIREVVNELYDEFDGEVPSKAIGGKVMTKLKKLDGVAYVRCASVYWRFDDAAEFLEAVQKFGTRDDTATIQLPGF